MNCAMEIHDSWLEDVTCSADGTGYAIFHASIFRSSGQLFKDDQESGWQRLRFDFEGMRVEAGVGDLDTWANGGVLNVNGVEQRHLISLPAAYEGTICLELDVSENDRTVKISATKMRSKFIGEFEIEGHWDASGKFTRFYA